MFWVVLTLCQNKNPIQKMDKSKSQMRCVHVPQLEHLYLSDKVPQYTLHALWAAHHCHGATVTGWNVQEDAEGQERTLQQGSLVWPPKTS